MKYGKLIALLCAAAVMASCSREVKDTPIPQATDSTVDVSSFDKVFTDVRIDDYWNAETNEIHSLIVLKGGKIIYERYAEGQEPDALHILWSASKTFTATAIGFAVQEGLLTVDDKVISFFDENELPAEPSDDLKSLTVKHLLTMTSGFARDNLASVEAGIVEHPAAEQFSYGFKFTPGDHFEYNSMSTYMLSAIITKLTGQTVEQYLESRLFQPLGIRRHLWETSTEGYSMGGWGLHITTQSLAKMGQFFLQRGVWNGKRLLNEEWFDEAMSVQVSTGDGQHGEWSHGYGYQMWKCSVPGMYRLDGAWGQFSIIIPDKDAVVACNCHSGNTGRILSSIIDNIYKNL